MFNKKDSLTDIADKMEKAISDLTATRDSVMVTMDRLEHQMLDLRLSMRTPQRAGGGFTTESTLTPNNGINVVKGTTEYWASPKIDNHTIERYNEIYNWCEETFKPGVWRGDHKNQYYYFDNKEDRDWFLVRWS